MKAEGVCFDGNRIKARFTTNETAKLPDAAFEVDIQADADSRPKLA